MQIQKKMYIPEPRTHAEKILAGRWALDWSSEAEETVSFQIVPTYTTSNTQRVRQFAARGNHNASK